MKLVGPLERTLELTTNLRLALMLLWLKDLMDVTEHLQFIVPKFRHLIRDDSEGTRQECRNVGSMNCNFSVAFIKSLNQSSIKPCLIVHLVAL